MSYDFREQLELSRLRDREIDKHLSGRWLISEEVPRSVERLGVDRVWINRETGKRWLVEYKHDTVAAKTGNAFVEIESVEGEKLGWAYTSCAGVLVYYVVEGEYALIVPMERIKYLVDVWRGIYPEKSTTTVDKKTGKAYATKGVCVPLSIFAAQRWDVEPIYSGDEETKSTRKVVPLRDWSGVLR